MSDETAVPSQHATGPTQPQVPEPSHAERARTLISLTTVAMLSTISDKHPGFPFGSLMPFALDAKGRPIFLISNMAMHTQNLNRDSRCSLFVAQEAAGNDPLGTARVTMIGRAGPVPESDLLLAREAYLSRHENSRYWVDFADFRFFRLEPLDLYYVGGFGVMGWVGGADYEMAAPDPLANDGPMILTHMNTDHENSMILLARKHTQMEASEATMTSIDRIGFTLMLETSDGMKSVRINFPRAVGDAQETRMMLVDMVRRAAEER